VDRAVIATAEELYTARHYPSVIAVCTDALSDEPDCVELRVIRARAYMKLRRDLDAQADLRDIIRISPTSADAYCLLGELASRRNENESAAIFFREALRLRPGDRDAAEWLQIIMTQLRPAIPAGSRFLRATTVPRIARGTRPPSEADPHLAAGSVDVQVPDDGDEPPTHRVTRPVHRGPLPELPGFADYLVSTGLLTRERLRAAQAYQRSMRVALSTAIVTLGLATQQRIEWAVVSHQAAQPPRRSR
jgi:tetratricopeptide (TPR) repeat protein